MLDISIIINCNTEKQILNRCLNALNSTNEYTIKNGVKTEIIAIADNSDELTVKILKKFKFLFKHLEFVDYADLAQSRNHGIKLAKGKYISLLDGDDFWEQDWLLKSFQFAQKNKSKNSIYHPEKTIVFGEKHDVFIHQSLYSNDYKNWPRLLFNNCWTSLSFAPRDLFLKFPYKTTKKSDGFGFEDWYWNSETLGSQVDHLVVPDTRHFVQAKPNSLMKDQFKIKSIVRNNSLYNKIFENKNKFNHQYLEETLVVAESCITQEDKVKMKWLSQFDLKLLPIEENIKKYKNWCPNNNPSTLAFLKILNLLKFKTKPTHIVFIPWLKRGGADQVALWHIRELCEANKKNQVLVIGTENSDSPWLNKLIHKNCEFIEVGSVLEKIEFDQKVLVLARLVHLFQPQLVHVIQSFLGWSVLQDYGRSLKINSKLYASVFLDDVLKDGQKFGYARLFLENCYESLTGLFSDNLQYLNELKYDFSDVDNKFSVIYSQNTNDKIQAKPALNFNNNILWASRIDQQKRPDVLIKVAKKNQNLNFWVYGEAVLDSQNYFNDLKREAPSNIHFMGAFNNINEVFAERQYSCFMYTSDNDGVPIILIDLSTTGIPIVAPDVGGITELLNNTNSHIIQNNESVEEYTLALKDIQKNYKGSLNKAKKLVLDSKNQHSQKAFNSKLKAIKYI